MRNKNEEDEEQKESVEETATLFSCFLSVFKVVPWFQAKPYDFYQQNSIINGLSVSSASLTLASLLENSQHGYINPL